MLVNMQRLEMFVAVVEAGTFTRAAQTLGLTKAVVSFNIKQLEQELGVALLTRSTRQISVTQTGERFYHHCQRLLQEAERVLEDVRGDHAGLTGTLRITTTPEYGARVVAPVLAEFVSQHPELRIQFVSSSQNDDLIAGRFDVAIRLGQLTDSNHHARLIDNFAIFPVASPAYLAHFKDETIHSLQQLAEANWIAHSRLSTPLTWQVLTPEGEHVIFEASQPVKMMADSASALLAFALNGAGVALLPSWLVKEALEQHRLVRVLPDHQFPQQGIYALYPGTRHVPEKVRRFIDFLHARING